MFVYLSIDKKILKINFISPIKKEKYYKLIKLNNMTKSIIILKIVMELVIIRTSRQFWLSINYASSIKHNHEHAMKRKSKTLLYINIRMTHIFK